MMKRLTDRVTVLFVILSLTAASVPAGFTSHAEETSAAAEGEETKTEFVIRNADDWERFAGLSSDDEWSKNRRVVLDADISLPAGETVFVPYFDGEFDGEGHAVNGVTLRTQVSGSGLFRLVDTDGLVKDLKVIGAVLPGGQTSEAGGITAVNRGRIEGCTFKGSINAHANAGCIAGINEETGVISGCVSEGMAVGDSAVGGIAGQNAGTIARCTNRAMIDTVYTDVPFSMDALSLTVDKILQTGRVTTPENVSQKTNIGGIAGDNTGSISYCVSEGDVGYEHVGFAVGGIAGRSTGLIDSCTNSGSITGRRDVGGIAGQQQPDLAVNFTEGKLTEISDSLDDLQGLVDRALTATEGYTNDTSARLLDISRLIGNARGDVRTLTDDATARADAAAARSGQALDTLKKSLTDLTDIAVAMIDYVNDVQAATEKFEKELKKYIGQTEMPDEDRKTLLAKLTEMNEQAGILRENADRLKEALESGISLDGDAAEDVKQRIKTIASQYKDMLEELNDIEVILAKYDDAAVPQTGDLKGDIGAIDKLLSPVRAAITHDAGAEDDLKLLDEASDEYKEFLDSPSSQPVTLLVGRLADIEEQLSAYTVKTPDDGGEGLSSRLQRDLDKAGLSDADKAAAQEKIDGISAAAETIDLQLVLLAQETASEWSDNGADYVNNQIIVPIKAIVDATSKLSEDAGTVSDILLRYAKQVDSADISPLDEAAEKLARLLNHSPDISEDLSGALYAVASIDTSVTGVSETARNAGNDLYSTIGSMITQSDALNVSLRDAASGTVGNLKDINDQMGKLGDLVEEAVREQLNKSMDPADYTRDVSEDDLEDAKSGRITECRNAGAVTGDGDTGGIAGLIGVDMDLDPGRDISVVSNRTTNATLAERAIVDNCTNEGFIDVKNGYAGGIAGRMRLGILYACRNLGRIDSGGDYAGGIAGYSGAIIKECYARCVMHAVDYAGGIAGMGSILAGNRAMVNVDAGPGAVGSIAGAVDEISPEKLTGNLYCGGNIRAVGGVDHRGMAQATKYDIISGNSDGFFDAFRVTFVADGHELATLYCGYGEDIGEYDIPEVPAKEGFCGKWMPDAFTDITGEQRVEAVYSRALTMLESDMVREGGIPVFYAEGVFSGDGALTVERYSNEKDGKEERFEIKIVGSENSEGQKLRFLPREDMGRVEIYDDTDGPAVKPLPAGTMGKYITFEINGSSADIRVVKKKSFFEKYMVQIICAGVFVLLAAAVALTAAGRRRKRAGAGEADRDDEAAKQQENDASAGEKGGDNDRKSETEVSDS